MEENVPTMSLEEQMDVYLKDKELAEAMTRLKTNPDFVKVFEEKFVKDFTLTQVYNLVAYDQQSRVKVHEQMVARSVFQRYCDELIEDGKIAIENMAELKSEQ